MGDYIRWSPPYYEGAHDSARSALFLALNRNKRSIRLDLKSERGPRGAAAAGARIRRRARVVPPGRARPPRRRLRAHARGEPGHRLLRDLRLRPGRAQARRLRARHELPRADRPARPDRRARRRAGAGGGPDRRHRRRRADGRVRDHGGAARARRRRASATALGRRRARARASSSTCRWPTARCRGWRWSPATYFADGNVPRRGELPLAGSLDLLPPVRVRRRLGHARRAGAEVLAGLVPRRRPRGPGRQAVRAPGLRRRTRRCARSSRARTRAEWEAFAREHDCCLEPVLELDEALASELVREREMVVEIDQPGVERPVRQLGMPVKLVAHPGRARAAARAGARRAHRGGAARGRLHAPRRSPSCSASGAAAGPAGEAAGATLRA